MVVFLSQKATQRENTTKERSRWSIATTPFDPNRYYTHLSLILFLIAIVLPKGFLKTALLLNTIFVGVMGNLVFLRVFRHWVSEGYNAEDLLLTNLMGHTIPMFLAFIILMGYPPSSGRTVATTVFLSSIFLLWAAVPYNGMNMADKIYDSYRTQIGVLVVMTLVLTVSSCKSIEYFRIR